MIEELARAKVNLYLHVTGKREDGYHTLDSLVTFADFGDIVCAEEADDLTLTGTGQFGAALPVGEDNLVLRAATELRKTFGIRSGAALTLEKNLPLASGIGGGSADAAAALRLCCALWSIDPGDPRIPDLCLSIGADVPVCFYSRTAIMRGVGEDLTFIDDFPPLNAVLANPGIGLSTSDVFSKFDGTFSEPEPWQSGDTSLTEVIAQLQSYDNDLRAPASSLAPDVTSTLTMLQSQVGCAFARMSGSGATCFGLFDDQMAAQNAATAYTALVFRGWAAPCTLGG